MEKYINSLRENHQYFKNNLTDNNCVLIIDAIKEFVSEKDIIIFIEDELILHESHMDALAWLTNGEEISIYYLKNHTITSDEVGKSITEAYVEGYDNYKKILENIHMTWWL